MSPIFSRALFSLFLILSLTGCITRYGYDDYSGSYATPNASSSYSVPGALSTYSAPGPVHVKGYYRKDGTYVRPHTRTRPDGIRSNSRSYRRK
ncbi:hypothetical protein D3C86_1852470 [compost metagenome]